MENLGKQTNDFLGIDKFNWGGIHAWNFDFQDGNKNYLRGGFNCILFIFIICGDLFLKLFGNDLKFAHLFKSHVYFSSTELCAQSFHVVIWLHSHLQLVFED